MSEINYFWLRVKELILISPEDFQIVPLRVVARNSRKNIHSYLEIEGELDWKFKKGNKLLLVACEGANFNKSRRFPNCPIEKSD